MIAGEYVPRNLRCLAEDGRHVTIAVQGGMTAEVNMVLMMTKRLILTRSTLRARPIAFKSTVAEELSRIVWPHVVEHSIFRHAHDLARAIGAGRLCGLSRPRSSQSLRLLPDRAFLALLCVHPFDPNPAQGITRQGWLPGPKLVFQSLRHSISSELTHQ
jgi:hypothetical protein